jgi:hypothetical protein
VVEKALEADPNNTDAKSLDKITGNRLIIQNAQESLDDIFGAAGDDPFAAPQPAADAAAPQPPAPQPPAAQPPVAPAPVAPVPAAQTPAADVFGDAPASDPFAAPVEPRATTVPPVDRVPAPVAPMAPRIAPPDPRSDASGVARSRDIFADPSRPAGDDELLEEPGG